MTYPASVAGNIVVTWSHRSRLLQADQLVDTTQGNIGPEAGTTYTCRVLRADTLAVLDSHTSICGTSQTLTTSYEGDVIVELWSVRGGMESMQKHQVPMAHSNT